MVISPVMRELDHQTADDHLTVGVISIPYRQGHSRIATYVRRLHATFGGVHENVIAVGVDPHGGRLR